MDDASAGMAPTTNGTPEAITQNTPEPAQVVEALLFASDAPLAPARLAEMAGVSPRELTDIIHLLNEKYAAAALTFRIEAIARGYQMLTVSGFETWLARLDRDRAQTRLSPAALETLSIIAYKQPIMRAEIESIRGVSSGDGLNRLKEMGLIKIAGRADVVGRPMLYGTTRKFLDLFGLRDLSELPPMEALKLRPAPPPAESGAAEARVAAGA